MVLPMVLTLVRLASAEKGRRFCDQEARRGGRRAGRCVPASHAMRVTVPSCGAWMASSIFIASSSTSTSPAATRCPTLATMRVTVAGIGASSPCAARGARRGGADRPPARAHDAHHAVDRASRRRRASAIASTRARRRPGSTSASRQVPSAVRPRGSPPGLDPPLVERNSIGRRAAHPRHPSRASSRAWSRPPARRPSVRARRGRPVATTRELASTRTRRRRLRPRVAGWSPISVSRSSAMKPVSTSPASEARVGEDARQERRVGAEAEDEGARQRRRRRAIAASPRRRVRDDLGDERVVLHRDRVAALDAGIDAKARHLREATGDSRPGLRQEALLGVLGAERHFDRVARAARARPAATAAARRRDRDLRVHQIDAGDRSVIACSTCSRVFISRK